MQTPTQCLLDLKIDKFGKPDGEVRAGDTLRYYLRIRNLGPSQAPAGDVKISDLLASSGTFTLLSIASQQAMTCAPNPLTLPQQYAGSVQIDCTLNQVLGVNQEWLVVMDVTADDTQDINNHVDVFSTNGWDPNPDNNHAEVEHDITDVADLSVSKTDDTDPVVAGTEFNYLIEVENDGPSAAENVVLVDTLPAGVTVVNITAPGPGSCATVQGTIGSNQKVTCDLGTILADGELDITIRVRVDENMPDGTILWNEVFVYSDIFDPNNQDNISRARTEIVARADLSIEKEDDPDPNFVAGGEATYTINVANDGPSTAVNVVVGDDLPTFIHALSVDVVGVTDELCSIFPVPGSSTGRDRVRCELGNLAVGAKRVIVIHARVAPDAVPADDANQCIKTNNTATITSDTRDPDTENNSSTAGQDVCASADLEIQKWSEPVKVNAGEQKKYTVKVTNHGPSNANDVVIEDTLPIEVEYEINTGLCAVAVGGGQNGEDVVTCKLGTLPPGGMFQFDIWALVKPDTAAGTLITNTATVTSSTPDPDEANNTAQSQNLVLGKADLKVTKFGKMDGQVRAGDVLTYTVIVDNLGPSFASGVSLKDVLRSSGTFTVIGLDSDLDMTCESEPTDINVLPLTATNSLDIDCTLDQPLGVLQADGFPNPGRWTLTMYVMADQTQDINNVADVLSAAADPDPSNNHAEVQHEITDVADMSLDKQGPSMVTAGETITWDIVVKNDGGPSNAENVVVYDRLPPGVVVTDVTVAGTGGGSCTTGTAGSPIDKLVCNLGTFAVNQEKKITIVADVDPGLPAGTVLENDAYVLSDIFDDNNLNNGDHTLTTVKSIADLSVTKQSDRDDVGDANDDAEGPAVAGTVLEYILRVTNGGPSDAAEVLVVDTLPAGTTYLSATITEGTGTCSGLPTGQVKCQLGTLETGKSVEIVVRVLVNPDYNCAVPTLRNRVEVTSPSDEDGATTEIETRVVCDADVGVEKWSSPVKVNAGEQKKYTVKVTNYGPSDAENVVVIDTLPAEVEYEIDTFGCAVALGEPDVLTCDIGTLPPGAMVQFDIYGLVDADTPAGMTIVNRAELNTSPPRTPDSNPDNDVATSANLVLQKAGPEGDEVRQAGRPGAGRRHADLHGDRGQPGPELRRRRGAEGRAAAPVGST